MKVTRLLGSVGIGILLFCVAMGVIAVLHFVFVRLLPFSLIIASLAVLAYLSDIGWGILEDSEGEE